MKTVEEPLNTIGTIFIVVGVITGILATVLSIIEKDFFYFFVGLSSLFGGLCSGYLFKGISNIIDFEIFIYSLITGYYLRLLLIILYGFRVYRPTLTFKLPPSYLKILFYSFLIFLSGAASSIILDIDKSMIASLITSDDVAFYSVALFIAAVIEAPGRAMFQIISPLVSKAINSDDKTYLTRLLKKSSNNLFLVSGMLFLLINLNLTDFYVFVNQPMYAVAIGVVSLVSIGKLYSMSIGCLNNIISNSKFYPYIFWFSILSAVIAVILNFILIPEYGILGAAYATLFVIIFINTLKLILISYGLKIHPYSIESIKILLIIIVVFFLVKEINLSYSSFLNLSIRSVLIIVLYSSLSHVFGLLSDINSQVNKYLNR